MVPSGIIPGTVVPEQWGEHSDTSILSTITGLGTNRIWVFRESCFRMFKSYLYESYKTLKSLITKDYGVGN